MSFKQEFKEISKELGKKLARQAKIKRPFATKTEALSAGDDDTLQAVKDFIEIAKEIEKLSKDAHFSYLERLARKAKDDCKTLFPKIEAELNKKLDLNPQHSLYLSKRDTFLLQTKEVSENIGRIYNLLRQKYTKAQTDKAARDLVDSMISSLRDQITD